MEFNACKYQFVVIYGINQNLAKKRDMRLQVSRTHLNLNVHSRSHLRWMEPKGSGLDTKLSKSGWMQRGKLKL